MGRDPERPRELVVKPHRIFPLDRDKVSFTERSGSNRADNGSGRVGDDVFDREL